MGRAVRDAFPAAAETWEEVDDALSFALSRLAFEGPDADLTRTEFAQPALLTHSLALLRVMEREGGVTIARAAQYAAGHSLGEYTALTAAGSFPLADAARLVRRRGQAMQAAVPVGEGAMAALIGADLAAADALVVAAAAGDVLAIGNDNAPGQIVVSGTAAAVDRAAALAPEHGFRRAIHLTVSAPFHCPLMEPAAREMEEALAGLTIRPPAISVIANVNADVMGAPAMIRDVLVAQVTERVRWRESMERLRQDGVETLVEIGPGKVLSGLARRIDRNFETMNVAEPEDLEALLRAL
jgi:[acyl-carrier-protein] S-malonyltransferase